MTWRLFLLLESNGNLFWFWFVCFHTAKMAEFLPLEGILLCIYLVCGTMLNTTQFVENISDKRKGMETRENQHVCFHPRNPAL